MCTNSVGGRSTPPPLPLAVSSDGEQAAPRSSASSQESSSPAPISIRVTPTPGGDPSSSSSVDHSPLTTSSTAMMAIADVVNPASSSHGDDLPVAARPGLDAAPDVVIDIHDAPDPVIHIAAAPHVVIDINDGPPEVPPPVGGAALALGGQVNTESSVLQKAGRLALSFGRDAIVQYGAKVLATTATTALSQAIIGSTGGLAASAALNIGLSLSIGVGMNVALNRAAGVASFNLGDTFTREGSVLTKTARVVGMAAPLLLPLVTLAATQSAEATVTVSQVFLANQVARTVRQVGQSFIATPQTTGLALATQGGQALSEAETVRLNTVRDLFYVASSLALTAGGMHVVPSLFSAVHGEFDLSGPLFGALNEGADAVNPDLAKILYSHLPAILKPAGAEPNDELRIRDAPVPPHLASGTGLATDLAGRAKDLLKNAPMRLLLGATGADVLGAVIALGKQQKWDSSTLVALTVINTALSAALTAPRARLMNELIDPTAVAGGLATETSHALGVGMQALGQHMATMPVMAVFQHHPAIGMLPVGGFQNA